MQTLPSRLAPPVATVPAGGARLAQLRAQPREPGEASFFFYDAHFANVAVKVLPGEYFVASEDLPIMTTLGSCIAACLWDRQIGVGGMNHFLLPHSDGEGEGGSGRYGAFAMELLINKMMKLGAVRSRLEAKVFGGGHVINGMSTLNIGERNTRFVLDYLKTERITVISKDVLDIYPRKVCFFPASGKAMVKRLAPSRPDVLEAQEKEAVQTAQGARTRGGTIDLF